MTTKPELIYDPDTDRYSILVDSVEVISGLDPIGLRYPRTPATTEAEPVQGVERKDGE